MKEFPRRHEQSLLVDSRDLLPQNQEATQQSGYRKLPLNLK